MIDLTQMRVLVTGADGFIGSHLVEALHDSGADVRAFVQYNSFGRWGWLDSLPETKRKDIDVVLGDVRDRGSVREAMRGCQVVLHLAALIAIPYSYQAPQSYIDTNVTGTLNVLEAARDLGVQRVVHTSTSEVYGTARYVPIDEGHPLQAQSPYAASKAAADHLALSYQRSFGLPVVVVRPFNTYGPRQSTRAVIPTVITQIAGGADRIRLGALHPTRDFTFVADTVAGFITMAACDSAVGEVVNIGSGFEISVGNMVALVAKLMERPVVVETASERMRPADSEVERLFADVAKVGSLSGWSPLFGGIAGFSRGLERTIAWFSDPMNLAHYRQGYQV